MYGELAFFQHTNIKELNEVKQLGYRIVFDFQAHQKLYYHTKADQVY